MTVINGEIIFEKREFIKKFGTIGGIIRWNIHGRGDHDLNTAKDRLIQIIDEISDQEIDEILDFSKFLKAKNDKSISKNLAKASESSLDIWDNGIWNNIWARWYCFGTCSV